jgi:hypothetical protein
MRKACDLYINHTRIFLISTTPLIKKDFRQLTMPLLKKDFRHLIMPLLKKDFGHPITFNQKGLHLRLHYSILEITSEKSP